MQGTGRGHRAGQAPGATADSGTAATIARIFCRMVDSGEISHTHTHNSYNALNTFHMFDLAGASGQSGSVFNEVLLLKQFSSEETMGGEACWLLAVRTTTHPSSYLGHLVSRGPSPPIIRPHEARFGSRHQEPRTMVTKCHDGVYQPTLIRIKLLL